LAEAKVEQGLSSFKKSQYIAVGKSLALTVTTVLITPGLACEKERRGGGAWFGGLYSTDLQQLMAAPLLPPSVSVLLSLHMALLLILCSSLVPAPLSLLS